MQCDRPEYIRKQTLGETAVELRPVTRSGHGEDVMKQSKRNRISRRNFMVQSAVMSLGVSGASNTVLGQQAGERRTRVANVVSVSSQMLLHRFGLKYPIFQAAPGGEALAVAVANAGGMGAISLTWDTPEQAFDLVTRMNKATKGNYYANFVLHFEPRALNKALEAGCPVIQFSWGIPDADIVSRIRGAHAKLGIQVSSRLNVERALERDPDFLICQGLEAGGHVQAMSAIEDSLQEVLESSGNVPVVAAGGISTGRDIKRVMNAGASGAVLGTRFMATQESDAHDVYKESLINANENSTAYTLCFNKDWNAPHRVLRNSTFLNWEAEGCPNIGSKPREADVVADHPIFGPAMRYETVPPMQGHEGALEEMAMYAGQGVGKVNDLPTANDLIARLWNEFETS
jgi:nitronate monooxygenase